MLGVVVAQLYQLQHAPSPDPKFGYFVLSKPIACIFQVSAVCVTLLGSVRFFRQQYAMSIGKVRAGGWELMIIGVYVLLVSEKVCMGTWVRADLGISFCLRCSRSMLELPYTRTETQFCRVCR
jgi:hypothetical protein